MGLSQRAGLAASSRSCRQPPTSEPGLTRLALTCTKTAPGTTGGMSSSTRSSIPLPIFAATIRLPAIRVSLSPVGYATRSPKYRGSADGLRLPYTLARCAAFGKAPAVGGDHRAHPLQIILRLIDGDGAELGRKVDVEIPRIELGAVVGELLHARLDRARHRCRVRQIFIKEEPRPARHTGQMGQQH